MFCKSFALPCRFVVAVAVVVCCAPSLAGLVIEDFSALPTTGQNTFNSAAGVQFLLDVDDGISTETVFTLESVTIPFGSTTLGTAATFDFSVIEFDGSIGDTTGTVLGTIPNLSFGYYDTTFVSFAASSVTIDASSLSLTLEEGKVYGLVAVASSGLIAMPNGGNSGTEPDVGSLNAGGITGTSFIANSVFPNIEVPFTLTAVPEPSAFLLLGVLAAGIVARKTLCLDKRCKRPFLGK